MTRVLCAVLGHRWVVAAAYAPKFYACSRCKAPGFEMPRREK